MASLLTAEYQGQVFHRRTARDYKFVVIGQLAQDIPGRDHRAGQWIAISWASSYQGAVRKAQDARSWGHYGEDLAQVQIVQVQPRA
jgi:hypothetical protein